MGAVSQRRPLRVLMVATCPFPTRQGTQVYIGQMAEWLARAGHHVALVTYGHGEGDLVRHDRGAAFAMHRAARGPGSGSLASGPSWERPASDALLTWRAWDVARRAQREGRAFDLVHAHNYEGALAGAIVGRALGLPVLYHAHNLMSDELPTYFEGAAMRRLASWAGRALDRGVPGLADRCLAVSRHAQARLSALHEVPISWHPPAVSCPAPTGSSQASVDAVYLGNLDGYQNPAGLFEALAWLRARRSGLRVAAVTADPAPRWERWLSRYGLGEVVRVVPHGDFEHAWGWLCRARVALLPRTVASGFPIKLINYLAAGRPVVASEGGAQGLGVDEGVVVVPDGQPVAFARALGGLLDDPARAARLGRQASAAASGFMWPARGAALEREYWTLIDAGTRQSTGWEAAKR